MSKFTKIFRSALTRTTRSAIRIPVRHSTCSCGPKVQAEPKHHKEEKSLELCGAKRLMDPKCKSAVVTGGISGIGLAAASQLLHLGGRQVVIMGTDCCLGKEAENLLNCNYGRDKANFIKVNLNHLQQTEEAFKNAHEYLKGIDIVINAAGILDGANWEKEVVTNVIGTIRGTLLAFKYASKDGQGKGGVVVNVSGTYGLDPLPQAPTYAACQHAILGFSRSFGDRQHEQRSGLRVVTLCPGFTTTDLLCNLENKGMTEIMGLELQKKVDKAKKQKRDACGEAVAHLVQYAETGSVWVVEGSRLFYVDRPKREKCSKLVAQFI